MCLNSGFVFNLTHLMHKIIKIFFPLLNLWREKLGNKSKWPPSAACCLQVWWTLKVSVTFDSWELGRHNLEDFFIWRKEFGFSTDVSCCVVEKAGVNQVWLCLLQSKHSCNTSLGIDNLSATLKRKLEQKKSVPKEMDCEVCIPKSIGQVRQYKSLRCLWNVIQDFSVALFLLKVRMYKMKGQILRSEFSFSQSLATCISLATYISRQ